MRAVSVGQRVGEQDDAEHREDRRRHQRDRARVPLEPVERAGELAHGEPDGEERHPEPERVRDEQRRSSARGSRRVRRTRAPLPSIGPMHGVQPRPNAAPATGAATGPKRSRCGWKRNSW